MNLASYKNFRRVAVPSQVAQQLQTITIPAPTRGLILNENESFMQPGGALVLDNWRPTLKGTKLRGGALRYCALPETTSVISMFGYLSGNVAKLFAANATKIYDVTSGTPVLARSGQTSGNYAASQLANASGDYLIAINDAGDLPMRFDGTTWTRLASNEINAAGGTAPEHGGNLVYVWKYRNRWFFIEKNSMNAWYLPLNAIQGTLLPIPLSGAATKGGKLLFGCTWSVNAGDGLGDKCVFATDQGELIVFSGGDPSSSTNWAQQGRYTLSKPLGMNAHQAIGGDVLVATVDGIIPMSASIDKDASQLEMAAITRPIKTMWQDEVVAKQGLPWTMAKWDEQGVLFVTWPGGNAGSYRFGVVNVATGAWSRYTGWDAMCFGRLGASLYFGTQGGVIMQAERGGTDDGAPYTATLVGGWEMFSSQAATVVWRQARASFAISGSTPFIPQLSAATDYVVNIPAPPNATVDDNLPDVWDQGKWGPDAGTPPAAPGAIERARYLQWDQPITLATVIRNSGWVSIGYTGFSHAPIVQATISQSVAPNVELISISATYDMAGVNV